MTATSTEPAPDTIDHDLARCCSECGATDPERCQGCGALVCPDCLELRSGELLCFECRLPPLCREPGCKVRSGHAVTDTRGYCLKHYRADLDRWIASTPGVRRVAS